MSVSSNCQACPGIICRGRERNQGSRRQGSNHGWDGNRLRHRFLAAGGTQGYGVAAVAPRQVLALARKFILASEPGSRVGAKRVVGEWGARLPSLPLSAPCRARRIAPADAGFSHETNPPSRGTSRSLIARLTWLPSLLLVLPICASLSPSDLDSAHPTRPSCCCLSPTITARTSDWPPIVATLARCRRLGLSTAACIPYCSPRRQDIHPVSAVGPPSCEPTQVCPNSRARPAPPPPGHYHDLKLQHRRRGRVGEH